MKLENLIGLAGLFVSICSAAVALCAFLVQLYIAFWREGNKNIMPRKKTEGKKIGQREAARICGVSVRSVQYASEIRKKGIPELATLVGRGGLAVSAAALVARLPKDQQREIVAKGADEVRRVAKEIRTKSSDND